MSEFLSRCSALDVESTSPYPESCEIIELAYSIYNGEWNVFSDHYKPSIPVPALSSEKHFICDAQLAHSPSFSDVINSSFMPVVESMEYFIAHNAKFDRTTIINNFKAHGLEIPANVANEDSWLCTLKLAKKLFSGDESIEALRLGYLWFQLGLANANPTLPDGKPIIPHQADSDIFMAAKLFEHLLGLMIERGIVDPNGDIGAQVIAYQNAPMLYKTFPFGKHKGKAFSEIPQDYYNWLMNNCQALNEKSSDFDEDFAFTVIAELERRGI